MLFPEVARVLLEIHRHPSIQIALASRTGQPSWLKQLAKLHVLEDTDGGGGGNEGEPLTLWSIAQYREVYPGSKKKHFRKISKQSGIACSDMLFFDDEPHSNRDVCELGVVFQDIPSFSDTGTTVDLVLQGLEMYARSKQ